MSRPNPHRRNDRDEDGTDCAHKFRTMLKCVERTGDIPSCTHQINTFLACERAVFRTALRADPRRISPSVLSSPPPQQKPQSASARNQQHPHDADASSYPPEEHVPFTTWFPDMFKRAVAKQAHACVDVVETLGNAESPARVLGYCQRICADVGHSFKLLGQKAVTMTKDLISRGKDDPTT